LFIIPIILTALGVVFILYFRNKENTELTDAQVWILRGLRFISFLLISVLLLSPLLKNLKKIIREPLIILAWDNSSSPIANADSVRLKNEIEDLKNHFQNELGEQYSLVQYTFGEEVKRNVSIDFSEKKSHYGRLITEVNNNHFNENVGAVVIIGDGIYNQGRNPVNLIDEISFPVYTVGLGDTTEITDARIERVRANRTAFLGNFFTVEADVHFSKLAGVPLRLSFSQNDVILEETIYTPPNNNYIVTHSFVIETSKPGINTFSVFIEPAQNEINIKNNKAEITINVLENKQKILVISDGPHPDIGAIKNTLDLQASYDVSVFTGPPYPSNIDEFNLIIFNQIPTTRKSFSEMIENANNLNIPGLFLVGGNTFLPQFNVLVEGAEIKPLAGSNEEAQATFNSSFATFSIDEELRELIPKFPPLLVPFADYELETGLTPLLFQKIRNIETSRPLVATGIIEGRKTGIIFGEGIWRWRLQNYFTEQNHNSFNSLINQLVQYLALRENEDNFIVNFKTVYDETENVVLQAEVYNDTYEPVNSEEVTIKFIGSEGDELDFTFDVRDTYYYLNTGNLQTGTYDFVARVTLGNEEFEETGKFMVSPVNFENVVTQANHQMLYQLATLSGGAFFTLDQSEGLTNILKENENLKATTYYQEMVNELLNLRWLFIVFVLLLSVEWFLRKFWGIY